MMAGLVKTTLDHSSRRLGCLRDILSGSSICCRTRVIHGGGLFDREQLCTCETCCTLSIAEERITPSARRAASAQAHSAERAWSSGIRLVRFRHDFRRTSTFALEVYRLGPWVACREFHQPEFLEEQASGCKVSDPFGRTQP